MNLFWKKLITKTSTRHQLKQKLKENEHSKYLLAKSHRDFLITLRRQLKDIFLITLAIFSASFGLKGFLLTNHFIDGGATGISLLISALTNIPIHILII